MFPGFAYQTAKDHHFQKDFSQPLETSEAHVLLI